MLSDCTPFFHPQLATMPNNWECVGKHWTAYWSFWRETTSVNSSCKCQKLDPIPTWNKFLFALAWQSAHSVKMWRRFEFEYLGKIKYIHNWNKSRVWNRNRVLLFYGKTIGKKSCTIVTFKNKSTPCREPQHWSWEFVNISVNWKHKLTMIKW
jgi:hypothetical protein